MSIEQIEKMQNMKLHETLEICDGLEAFRVPTGWIYRKPDLTWPVFVPDTVPVTLAPYRPPAEAPIVPMNSGLTQEEIDALLRSE